jgi:membrane-bound lytic murein transglycosylase A
MSKKRSILIVFTVILVICLAAFLVLLLEKKPVEWSPGNALHRVNPPSLMDSPDVGNVKSLIDAIDFSLEYLKKIDPQTPVIFGPDRFTARQVKESLEDFKSNLWEYGLTDAFYQYVKQNYTFYKSAADEVLVTGYYEAQLNGSLTQSETYRCPLYKKPEDLVRIDLTQFPFYQKYKGLPRILRGRLSNNNHIVPYYSREEIDGRQMLSGKDLEIVWIDNPIDVFFLQVQGSGIVQLDTGQKLRVNYDESNGHPYRAIGRLLVEQGILTYEDMSMQSIRQYLETHPDEMEGIFNYNPSYVFFRRVEQGPIGSLGVPVTAFRSVATDKYLFPKGALCCIETELPVFDEKGHLSEWKKYSGFVLNQDTGGAIRSPARVDLFTGHGKKSEWTAGHMKREGTFYFMIKNQNGL